MSNTNLFCKCEPLQTVQTCHQESIPPLPFQNDDEHVLGLPWVGHQSTSLEHKTVQQLGFCFNVQFEATVGASLLAVMSFASS